MKLKIARAYCVQLGRVISIDTAISYSADNSYCHLDFLCSDEKCRQQGVKITGVNYNKKPEVYIKSPHFKVNNKGEKHHPDCEWVALQKEVMSDTTAKNETPEMARVRQKCYSSSKVKEFYRRFVIAGHSTQTTKHQQCKEETAANNSLVSHSNSKHQTDRVYNCETTHSFSRLCQFHFEISSNNILTIDEIKSLPLEIVGETTEQTTYFQYFSLAPYHRDGMFSGITYGYLKRNSSKYHFNKDYYKYYLNHKDEKTQYSLCLLIKKDYADKSYILNHLDKFANPCAYFFNYAETISDEKKERYFIIDTDCFYIARD